MKRGREEKDRDERDGGHWWQRHLAGPPAPPLLHYFLIRSLASLLRCLCRFIARLRFLRTLSARHSCICCSRPPSGGAHKPLPLAGCCASAAAAAMPWLRLTGCCSAAAAAAAPVAAQGEPAGEEGHAQGQSAGDEGACGQHLGEQQRRQQAGAEWQRQSPPPCCPLPAKRSCTHQQQQVASWASQPGWEPAPSRGSMLMLRAPRSAW